MGRPLVFFDIETPNLLHNRICSLGMVVCDSKKEVYKKSIFVNPECRFDDRNINIHHVTYADVMNAQTFPDVWKEIGAFLLNGIIIGHNIKFDIRVLSKTLNHYKFPIPSFNTICTLNISRRNLNLEKYNLQAVCDTLRVPLNHHNALSDAEASSSIFFHFKESIDVMSFKKNITIDVTEEIANAKTVSKVLNELYGIICGVSCDSVVDEQEFEYIEQWRSVNSQYACLKPLDEIFIELDNVLENGTITTKEVLSLLNSIKKIAGDPKENLKDGALPVFIGIANGVLANPDINNHEIKLIQDWFKLYEPLTTTYPINVVYETIQLIANNPHDIDKYRDKLFEQLKYIIDPIGGENNSPPENIIFNEKIFCLTGEFMIGSKRDVTKLIESLGGIVYNTLNRKTDYLIVGERGSEQWKYIYYGNKIQQATQNQRKGLSIQVIYERKIQQFLDNKSSYQ